MCRIMEVVSTLYVRDAGVRAFANLILLLSPWFILLGVTIAVIGAGIYMDERTTKLTDREIDTGLIAWADESGSLNRAS